MFEMEAKLIPAFFLLAAFPFFILGQENFATLEQFRRAASLSGFKQEPSEAQYNSFNAHVRSVGKVASQEEAAMALAQFFHESGGLVFKRERSCSGDPCDGCPPCAAYDGQGCEVPGQHYFGRGFIQLTWCFNYKPASEDLFGDDRLLRDADQVAQNDDTAWRTSFWFWAKNVREKPGVQQGQFGATTMAINSMECTESGHEEKVQNRFRIYGKVREAFGLPGGGDPAGCK